MRTTNNTPPQLLCSIATQLAQQLPIDETKKARCEANKALSLKVLEFMRHVYDIKEESITDFLVWQWREGRHCII